MKACYPALSLRNKVNQAAGKTLLCVTETCTAQPADLSGTEIGLFSEYLYNTKI